MKARSCPFVLAAMALAIGFAVLQAAAYFVPGDPKKGLKLFFDKGCARCHSVLGEGGRRAPDLARSPAGHLDVTQLVAAMWNHAPEMWEKMQLEGYSPPEFKTEEMTDLFAFLYSVRSFDEPGSAERGQRLVIEKQCVVCHSIEGRGGQIGPDLRAWAKYRNPVTWTQTMWNHAPQMQQAMAGRKLPWPSFEGSDMSDVMAYVRTKSAGGSDVYMPLPEASRGRDLFRSKGCTQCHSTSDGDRLTFKGKTFPQTLGQFAGRMWNHSPQMEQRMEGRRIAWPEFSQSEMADLIAYLFSERYLKTSGNVELGREIFQVKRCAECHSGGPKSLAPLLGQPGQDLSAIELATAMWNHGPAMLATMRDSKVPWPRFEKEEIAHLLEFLKKGARQAQKK